MPNSPAVEALADEQLVALLEDVQRHDLARQQHEAEREQPEQPSSALVMPRHHDGFEPGLARRSDRRRAGGHDQRCRSTKFRSSGSPPGARRSAPGDLDRRAQVSPMCASVAAAVLSDSDPSTAAAATYIVYSWRGPTTSDAATRRRRAKTRRASSKPRSAPATRTRRRRRGAARRARGAAPAGA